MQSFQAPRTGLIDGAAIWYLALAAANVAAIVWGTRTSGTEQPQPGFVPAMVMPDPPPVQSTVLATPASGRMEIVVGKACRVIVDAGLETAALPRVLDFLEQQ